MTKHNKKQLVPIVLLALVAGIAAGPSQADAAQVRAALSSPEAYVGMPITVYVEITNARNHDEPALPEIGGTDVRSTGAASRRSQTTIINGHRSERTSVTYAWQITPRRAGEFVVPPIVVQSDGRTQSTRAMRFVANKSETGDLMAVEVVGGQEKIYVGQPLRLTLRVWLKPFHDASHDLTLSEANMWQLVSSKHSNWGTFAAQLQELAENRQRVRGQQQLRKDSQGVERHYYRYDIHATIYPKRPGHIDVGDVQIVANYPTSLARSRGFFSMGELAIDGSRPIAVNATVAPIEVLPVPTVGRPADYRGTVGRYEIVTQATPTSVKAGDPITLHIGIRGDGPMELVQAPPLAELPALTINFKVPDEALAGRVKDNVKVFRVSIRPRQEGITEIPAIPLTFFDPDAEKFITVRSEPIVIQVAKADTLSLSSIVGSATGGNASGEDTAAETIVLNNYRGTDVFAPAARIGVWTYVIWMSVAPLAYFIALGYKHRDTISDRMSGTRLASRRRAFHALSHAKSPHDVSTAVLEYVAYVLHLPHTSLTRDEAIRQLCERGNTTDIDHVDRLLAACEANCYAGDSQTNVEALAADATACIELLSAKCFVPKQPSRFNRPQFQRSAKKMAAGAGCLLAISMLLTPSSATRANELSTTQMIQIFAEANDVYALGQAATDLADAKSAFTVAAQKYQMLVDDGAHNGQLYFNLGNAYLQQGDTARALANYERAKVLLPYDASVARNRNHAQEMLGVAAPMPHGIFESTTTWLDGISPRTMLIGCVAAWFIMWVALVGGLFFKRRALRYAVIPAAISFGICAAVIGYEWTRSPTHDRGMVVAESTLLLEGNGKSFAPTTGQPLQVGGDFELVEQRDDWLRVRLADGQTGWIAADQAEVIAQAENGDWLHARKKPQSE